MDVGCGFGDFEDVVDFFTRVGLETTTDGFVKEIFGMKDGGVVADFEAFGCWEDVVEVVVNLVSKWLTE